MRDAFAANFANDLEVGACFCAAVAGKTVVDLWGGLRDARAHAAVGARHHRLRLVDHQGDDGGLRLDAGGARRARPRRAGGPLLARVRRGGQGRAAGSVPALAQLGPRRVGAADRHERPLRLGALDGAARRADAVVGAGHRERLPRGDASGIWSARSCAAITGRSLGRFFRDEVAAPLGADFHIGLADEHEPRLGDMISPAPGARRDDRHAQQGDDQPARLVARRRARSRLPRRRSPGANGHGNARAVARVGAALASGGVLDGVRLLPERFFDAVLEEQIYGQDLVLGLPIRWGLGVGLPSKEMPLPSPRSFYWGGWGGSLCLIDLDAQVACAYVMNKMSHTTMGDRRGLDLVAAVYASLRRRRSGDAPGIRERAPSRAAPADPAPRCSASRASAAPSRSTQVLEREDQRRVDGARQEVGGEISRRQRVVGTVEQRSLELRRLRAPIAVDRSDRSDARSSSKGSITSGRNCRPSFHSVLARAPPPSCSTVRRDRAVEPPSRRTASPPTGSRGAAVRSCEPWIAGAVSIHP